MLPSIDLMAGPNSENQLVTNVVSGLDGTDDSLTPFKWTCPNVDPNSAIYFYRVCTILSNVRTRLTLFH